MKRWLWLVCISVAGLCAQPPAGQQPQAARQDAGPRLEFVFEELVTLGPGPVMGETAYGRRNIIPITGGTVEGPKLKGKVLPGGWDYQLSVPGGCTTISADYFLQTDDGVVIKVLNNALACAGKLFTRPVFEAPKGKYDWLTKGVFVGVLEAGAGGVKIKFYQAL